MRPALIANTDESTREELKKILAPYVPLMTVESQTHGRKILDQKIKPGIVFMGLETDDGMDATIFSDIRDHFPELTVIAVGDAASEDIAIEAVRQGATGYMIKPLDAEEVLALARQKTNA